MTSGGGKGARTPDLRLAKPALSQLSYTPRCEGDYTASHTYGKSPRELINALAATRLTLGRLLTKGGGPNRIRTCDLTVISRAL